LPAKPNLLTVEIEDRNIIAQIKAFYEYSWNIHKIFMTHHTYSVFGLENPTIIRSRWYLS